MGEQATETAQLTQDERATYQALRARGCTHGDALADALDGVHVDDVRLRFPSGQQADQ